MAALANQYTYQRTGSAGSFKMPKGQIVKQLEMGKFIKMTSGSQQVT